VYALLASPHFGIHWPFWAILPIGAAVAALFGVLIGAPTLKMRGDYLAIVTLGFGEIVRIFLNNLSRPVNITNGPQGSRASTRSGSTGSISRSRTFSSAWRSAAGQVLLFPAPRPARGWSSSACGLQNSRIGRAWEAIREDEVARARWAYDTTAL